jgi:uncharacterized membrane protein
MKKSTPNLLLALVLSVLPIAYAAYLYPNLPNTIPIHFNIRGEADRFGGRDSIFLAPGIMAVTSIFVFFLLTNIKNFDPKRYKEENNGLFNKFALFMVGFLSALSIIISYSTSNPSVNAPKLILPLIGLSFAAMGLYLPKIHQNYFAGFKLPWTLENADNWNETHKLAGTVWLYGGLFQAVSTITLSSMPGFICFMTATAVMVIIPTIFSYRMFKNGNQLP